MLQNVIFGYDRAVSTSHRRCFKTKWQEYLYANKLLCSMEYKWGGGGVYYFVSITLIPFKCPLMFTTYLPVYYLVNWATFQQPSNNTRGSELIKRIWFNRKVPNISQTSQSTKRTSRRIFHRGIPKYNELLCEYEYINAYYIYIYNSKAQATERSSSYETRQLILHGIWWHGCTLRCQRISSIYQGFSGNIPGKFLSTAPILHTDCCLKKIDEPNSGPPYSRQMFHPRPL